MRAYRDEANSTLNKSLDRNNGFNIVQAFTEYVAAANTLAIRPSVTFWNIQDAYRICPVPDIKENTNGNRKPE